DQFTDTGQVSEDILSRIANKIVNNETLSEREQAIFTDKTSEIESLLREIRDSEATSETGETATQDVSEQSPQTETTTSEPTPETTRSWYPSAKSKPMEAEQEGNTWYALDSKGNRSRELTAEESAIAESNIGKEQTNENINQSLPDGVVQDPVTRGKNAGTYAKKVGDKWYESNRKGDQLQEIDRGKNNKKNAKRIQRLENALEVK